MTHFKMYYYYILPILLLSVANGSLAAGLLWIGDGNGNLGTVDVTTGNVNVIGNMGATMVDIAFDPNGDLYGVSSGNLYRIDLATAAASIIGGGAIPGDSLVFDADGTLYTATNSLYTVNPATGAEALVGNGGIIYGSSGDLAFLAGKLYLTSPDIGTDNIVILNKTTGEGTFVGAIGHNNVWGLATNNNIDLYGISGTRVLSVDQSTGAGSILFDYAGHGLGSAYGAAAAVIPIPAALPLFSSAFFGIIYLAKRRKRRD